MKWDERVEDRYDLGADFDHGIHWHDENEVIAPDMADEAVFRTDAFDYVVKNLRQNTDDTIAFVVRVPIVELFEMIEA